MLIQLVNQKARERRAAECAYETPCKQCIHPACGSYGDNGKLNDEPYLIAFDGHIAVTGPSVKFMRDWTLERMREYAAGRGWTVTEIGV